VTEKQKFCCSLPFDEGHDFGTVYLILLMLKDFFLPLIFVVMVIYDFYSLFLFPLLD